MYSLHTDTQTSPAPPLHSSRDGVWQYTHPQSSSLHHIDMVNEYDILSYPVTQCAIMLRLSDRLYPNPQAASSRGAGSSKNNNHNCSNITLGLGQRGWGDEWKKTKQLRYYKWRGKKTEGREMMRVGESCEYIGQRVHHCGDGVR